MQGRGSAGECGTACSLRPPSLALSDAVIEPIKCIAHAFYHKSCDMTSVYLSDAYICQSPFTAFISLYPHNCTVKPTGWDPYPHLLPRKLRPREAQRQPRPKGWRIGSWEETQAIYCTAGVPSVHSPHPDCSPRGWHSVPFTEERQRLSLEP